MRTVGHRYGRGFTFQWHLTVECGYRCSHCYITDPATYSSEKSGEEKADLDAIFDSIDNFYPRMERHFGFPFKKNIILTGGDPLLHPGFDSIVERASSTGYNMGILGCPDTFTDGRITFLKDHGVKSVQFSLDGLEETHDRFRGVEGSFRQTVEKALQLQEVFNVNIMFTLCHENRKDILPLIKQLAEEGIKQFEFARSAFLGGGAKMQTFPAEEYKTLLGEIHDLEQELAKAGSQLKVGKKDNLWKLFYYEKGLLDLPEDGRAASGCPCGYTSLSILSDGSLFICRRFNSKIGKLPDDDIFDLYQNHKDILRMRDINRYSGCGICRLKTICRGCPAVGASYFNEMLHRDPHCWRIVLPESRAVSA